jgi:hypothetical protein
LAESLADAVQSGDASKAAELAAIVKEEARKRAQYDAIIVEFDAAMEACRFDEAEALLEKARVIGQVAAHDITYYDTYLHFDRDMTVLDRIVQGADQDD